MSELTTNIIQSAISPAPTVVTGHETERITAVDMYNEMMDELCSSLEHGEEFKELRNYLNDHEFDQMPASANHHLNFKGGLIIHSVNVALELHELTENLGLKWQRKESPIIIGLLHDLCKLGAYRWDSRSNKWVYNDRQDFDIGGHGIASVVIAQGLVRLTEEEIYCIRYHMGAYEQKDWTRLDKAIKKYPNVLWTHTADMVASKLMEGKHEE